MNKQLSLAIVASMLMLFGFSSCKNKVNGVSLEEIVRDTIEVDSVLISEPSGYIKGHGYVDLGLSVKWATCNVGANSPSDYGNYYAWGEIRTKSSYTSENSVTYGKRMSSIAESPRYDVARVNWGITWRLPIKEEIYELINECTWEWTTLGGHKGYKVTGPNGNSIFLPATGARIKRSLRHAGWLGQYWSATPREDYTDSAYCLNIKSGGFYSWWEDRDNGLSVRPVLDTMRSTTWSSTSSQTQSNSSPSSSSFQQPKTSNSNVQAQISEPTGSINGYGYVDLGLSVKWATHNIGADYASDYGNYYAWGETRPKSLYTENNSVTCKEDIKSIAGNSSYDAATANWGGTWRLPTSAEIDELVYKCKREWTTQGGHKGYKVTGPSGNSIFLPAAGWRDVTSVNGAGEYGDYWSATSYDYAKNYPYLLFFQNGDFTLGMVNRYYGQSIRPVSE